MPVITLVVLIVFLFILPLPAYSYTTHLHVYGNSMKGIFEDGEEVDVDIGYYSYNLPVREDTILFNPTGDIKINRLNYVKTIRGIPGDIIYFIPTNQMDIFSLTVNGEDIKTTTNEVILFTMKEVIFLSGYLKENKIPTGAYLLFGNREYSRDSIDSRQFGMNGKKTFLGRVQARRVYESKK